MGGKTEEGGGKRGGGREGGGGGRGGVGSRHRVVFVCMDTPVLTTTLTSLTP